MIRKPKILPIFVKKYYVEVILKELGVIGEGNYNAARMREL